MATVNIPVQTLDAFGGKIEDVGYTIASADNHNVIHPGGTVFLVIKNGSGSSQETRVTAYPSARTFGRDEISGNTYLSIDTGAGEISIVAIPAEGFITSNHVFYVDPRAEASIEYACFKLTPTS